MYLDALLQFDSANTLTATAVSQNVIDQGANIDMGVTGTDPLKILVLTGAAAFTASGAATLNIQFQSSPDNSTWTTQVESGVIALASLTASTKLFQTAVPRTGLSRYLRLNYVVAAGPFTAGSIAYAGIVLDRQDEIYYPSAIVNNN